MQKAAVHKHVGNDLVRPEIFRAIMVQCKKIINTLSVISAPKSICTTNTITLMITKLSTAGVVR
jgi:hypothetical protein